MSTPASFNVSMGGSFYEPGSGEWYFQGFGNACSSCSIDGGIVKSEMFDSGYIWSTYPEVYNFDPSHTRTINVTSYYQ